MELTTCHATKIRSFGTIFRCVVTSLTSEPLFEGCELCEVGTTAARWGSYWGHTGALVMIPRRYPQLRCQVGMVVRLVALAALLGARPAGLGIFSHPQRRRV